MNLIFNKIVWFALLGLIGISGFSQTHIEIEKANTKPVIDGIIESEWNNYGFHTLNNILFGGNISTDDFSANFSSVWDNDNLYFIVEVIDDKKTNDSPEQWKDDAVEIYLDINNDKLTSYGADDYQYTFAWNDQIIGGNGPKNDVEYVMVDTDKGYTLEVRFPWILLGLNKIEPGTKLGLDVHVQDDDDGGEGDSKLAWFTSIDQSWNNPSLFATAELVGVGGVSLFQAEKPNVSVKHGFYNQPFDVTISSPVEGMQIYYTLDGTDPTDSKTATVKPAPAIIRIDPESVEMRGNTPGVVLRAASRKEGYEYSKIVTRSYIFIDKVKSQTANPGHDWPNYNVNDQIIQYPMNTTVTNSSEYSNLIDDALLEIPTISIVTDNKNLFDSGTGIYVNAHNDGREWERPSSVELINPDGSKGFQIDAGIRIRGGYSRNPFFRKHAFRLFFRSDYGESKLNYPMFENEGANSFDKIDLRCSQNFSWSKGSQDEAPYCTFNRDVFSRDLQREMGKPYTRSRYYHLYLNGMYWGLFQSQERSEARFASEYLGGNVEDYDVVRYGEATDGNLDSWRDVWDICQQGFSMKNYYKIQGLDENGVRDPSLKVMVDIDNLIDYMHIIFYTGNYDAPVSAWGGNKSINNFYCIHNRNDYNEGYKFFAHDNESTLLIDNINENYRWHPCIGINQNRVNLGNLNDGNRMVITNFNNFNPQWLHFKLTENEEYRTRFADRSYELYYNKGILTPEKTAELFVNRANAIDTAVIAESARWGDVGGYIYTKNDDWDIQIQRTVNEYFPHRSSIVIQQLLDENLLSDIDAPQYKFNDKNILDESTIVPSGSIISINNENKQGSIKYTVDGTDPRTVGGGISPSAIDGNDLVSLSLLKTTIVKARIFNNNKWSAIHTLKVIVDKMITDLQFSEIHYNPLGGDGFFGREYEFIELYNSGSSSINLTASYFKGIKYVFNQETIIEPGEYLTLASNAYTFNKRYNFDAYDEYGGSLSNGGERITLFNPSGDTIISVKYNDNEPWPKAADGSGFSLVPDTDIINVNWDDGINWRASSVIGGTPNAKDNKVVIPVILVNEILSNTDSPMVDAVELYNPNNYDVNIGLWYLSDEKDTAKWQIPEGTIIPGNGYVVFYEGHMVGNNMDYSSSEFGSEFSLNSHGDQIYVFSANQLGNLTGYVHGFDFGDSDVGVSYGRHIISTGNDHFVPMSETTLGFPNSYPSVGPLVINQIMYHPLDNEFEFIELVNTSNIDVPLFEANSLYPWKISGIDFTFPKNTIAKAGESIYLVESTLNPADFRFRYGIDNSVPVFNYSGSLDNNGETLILYKSAPEYTENNKVKNPYVRVDKVDYNDNSKWPDADGNGFALYRSSLEVYGNDPANWIAGSQGLEIKTLSLSSGIEGVLYHTKLIATGSTKSLIWSINSGTLPPGISLDPNNGSIEGTTTQTGEYPFVLQVSDEDGMSDEVNLVLTIIQNTKALAFDDNASTDKNYNVTIDVLKNDIDEDGDKASWVLSVVSEPISGTLTLNNDQTFTYLPKRDFVGTDNFTYQISDYAGKAEAQVLITVLDEVLTASIDVRVSQSSDDAEENIYSGQLWDASSDLEFTFDVQPGGDQIIGIRFQNLSIPQGALINKAFIQFKTDEINDSETSLTIKGEASDHSLTFSGDYSISSRQLTNSFVDWAPEPWMIEGEISEKQKTPDIGIVVQEIVNRSGWSSGNALAFVFSGTGTRVAESYNGDATGAPILHVEYGTSGISAEIPTAIASVGQDHLLNSSINLDGSNSYSPDGRKLNYYWKLESVPESSEAMLTNIYAVSPTFTADVFGTYVASLYVNNGVYDSEKVSVTIKIENGIPIANAGADQIRMLGAEIMLNGSESNDPEGEVLTYQWKIIEQPAGSNIKLDNANAVNPKFIADVVGDYKFSLTVDDGIEGSVPDEVVIRVNENQAPVANAGNDISIFKGEIVSLDAGASYDPEGSSLSYEWSIISIPVGSNMILSSEIAKKPTFLADVGGEYVFELVVSDGVNSSTPDQITVIVTINEAPIAEAGSNQNVKEGDVVYLDASASSDPENRTLNYHWDFITIPAGSNATIANVYAQKTSFVADKAGVYKIELQVSDDVNVSKDEIQVVADLKTSIQEVVLDSRMKVYPNPFFDKLYVELDNQLNENITFELYTVSGSLVERIEKKSSNTEQLQLNFNQSSIKNGIYLLMLKSPNSIPQVVRIMYHGSE